MSTSYGSTTQVEPQPRARRPIGLRETLALIFLTVGSIVFIVFGWIAGVILLWTSAMWSTREKLIGTVVLPGGLAPAYLLMTGAVGGYQCATMTARGTNTNGAFHHSTTVCEGGGPLPFWLSSVILAVLVLAPVVTAVWLGWVAARRANAPA